MKIFKVVKVALSIVLLLTLTIPINSNQVLALEQSLSETSNVNTYRFYELFDGSDYSSPGEFLINTDHSFLLKDYPDYYLVGWSRYNIAQDLDTGKYYIFGGILSIRKNDGTDSTHPNTNAMAIYDPFTKEWTLSRANENADPSTRPPQPTWGSFNLGLMESRALRGKYHFVIENKLWVYEESSDSWENYDLPGGITADYNTYHFGLYRYGSRPLGEEDLLTIITSDAVAQYYVNHKASSDVDPWLSNYSLSTPMPEDIRGTNVTNPIDGHNIYKVSNNKVYRSSRLNPSKWEEIPATNPEILGSTYRNNGIVFKTSKNSFALLGGSANKYISSGNTTLDFDLFEFNISSGEWTHVFTGDVLPGWTNGYAGMIYDYFGKGKVYATRNPTSTGNAVEFYLDRKPPNIADFSIIDQDGVSYTNEVQLQIDASDNDEIVEIQVSNDDFLTYESLPYPSNGVIDWKLLPGTGGRKVAIKAIDYAGNVSVARSDGTYLIYDGVPPEVNFEINYGKSSTDSNTVPIKIEATDDNTTFQNLRMRLSLDGVNWHILQDGGWTQNNNEWGPVQSYPPDFYIGSTPEQKYFFLQVKDENNNVTNKTATIVRTSPATEPTTNETEPTPDPIIDPENMNGLYIEMDGQVYQVSNSTSAVIHITNLQNVSEVKWSRDGISSSEYEPLSQEAINSGELIKEISFEKQGQSAVYIKFKSKDGAESDWISRKFLVDYTPPEVNITPLNHAKATDVDLFKLIVKVHDNVTREGFQYSYKVNDGSWSNYSLLPTDGQIHVSGLDPNTTNTITVKVVDQSGNVGVDTVTGIWYIP
ncbi:MAG: hypothetical protein H0Z33_11225 [Bacillaceae bacterium]|nr:hypothetical protein [Bacillaceae bacterium]